MTNRVLLRNAMKTPDGTVIESTHRHDYVVHEDENGQFYMVDGGLSYLRRSLNEPPAQDLSIYSIPGDHEFNRQHFRWGTYGKDGDQPLRRVILADMSTNHIEAILETQEHIQASTRKFFEEELKYRAEENK